MALKSVNAVLRARRRKAAASANPGAEQELIALNQSNDCAPHTGIDRCPQAHYAQAFRLRSAQSCVKSLMTSALSMSFAAGRANTTKSKFCVSLLLRNCSRTNRLSRFRRVAFFTCFLAMITPILDPFILVCSANTINAALLTFKAGASKTRR